MVRSAASRWWVAAAVVIGVLGAAAGVGAVFRQPAPGVPASTTTPPPLGEQPGPRTVRFSPDAAVHPDRDSVRALLQGHFDAINLGDYRRWTTTVVAERAEQTSEDVWREQYRSTTDGSIVVHRMEPRPGGGLTVLLSFTSVQDPVDAPGDAPLRCLRWRVSYPVVTESDQLRIGPGDPDTSLREPC
ncbi:MAG: hypothetical protein ACRDT0_04050 [Pseudonocardiaceae bacterium]